MVGTVYGITYGNSISAYGARAKLMLTAAVADSAYGGTKNYGLAYDWVFELLSPTERTAVVNFIKESAEPFNGNKFPDLSPESRVHIRLYCHELLLVKKLHELRHSFIQHPAVVLCIIFFLEFGQLAVTMLGQP